MYVIKKTSDIYGEKSFGETSLERGEPQKFLQKIFVEEREI